MMKIILFVFLCLICFILLYFAERMKKSSAFKKVLLSIISSIVLTFVTSISYDYVKGIWFEENVQSGLFRGAYPYFVETNEEYGNFRIELEQRGNLSIEGFEISIGYVNSEYSRVIEESYSEPIWINIEPIEYEITIISPERNYVETYPCTIEDEGDTYLILPVYD